MSAVICEKDGYALIRPFNSWDMNYHLYDKNGNDYLIDIDNVCNDEEERNLYGGISWEELSTLQDIEHIKEYAWKIKERNEDSLQFFDVLSSI